MNGPTLTSRPSWADRPRIRGVSAGSCRDARALGLVRAGRGLARGGHDRAPQAGVRSESSLQDEPPLRLADPAGEPLRLPGAGIARVRRRSWPGRAAVGWLFARGSVRARRSCRWSWSPSRGSTRLAWFVVALGLAARLVPLLERQCAGFPAVRPGQFPGRPRRSVAILGASLWVGDRIKQSRESARPLPPPGSPNVLLIVLDTVAAGHLSLHGYDRPTSTTLVELAERGIRFDSARAASSWTLPSHATMFTGRWLHELSVGWLTPLDRTHPTLAEFLGDRGYATAGFVANTWYCATDSGLARGFTHYQDFIFPELTAFKTAVLVNRALEGYPGDRLFHGGLAGVRRVAALCSTPLAVARHRSQGGGGGQSRAPRLAVAAPAAGAAVLRLPELLRRPLSLSAAAGTAPPLRGRADATTISAS